MANQNLSQFGENTSVSDADYTFVWDSAASISKKVSRNSWLNSGTLTSDAPVTISQTWNALAVAFTALKVNATSTNSAAASKLLDLQVGGVSKFSVDKSGIIALPQTGGDASALICGGTAVTNASIYCGIYGLRLSSASPITWSSSTNLNIQDTILVRDGAANTLALRNGGNPQTFNVYGTYTSASVYERMFMRYNGTDLAFQVGAETLGATARPLQLWTGGASRLHVTTAGNVGIGTTVPRYRFSNTNVVLSDFSNIDPSVTSGFGWMASEANKYASNFSNNTVGGYGMSIFANSNETQKLLTLSNNSADVVNFLANGNVGIGTTSPTSKLQVSAGDVEVDTIAKGVILKSPDGTRYRVTVANGGTLSVAAV